MKHNFKAHTDSVHPGKIPREKLNWAAFDHFASKSNREGESRKKDGVLESNQNWGTVDVSNSFVLDVPVDEFDDVTATVSLKRIIIDKK